MLARRPNSNQLANFDGLQLQHGGAVKSATKVLMKDEALSSLTKGRNDYIMPGGNSVVSRTLGLLLHLTLLSMRTRTL